MPLVAGVAVLVTFGLYEWKARPDGKQVLPRVPAMRSLIVLAMSKGLVDHKLFSINRNVAISFWVIFVEGIMFYGFVVTVLLLSERSNELHIFYRFQVFSNAEIEALWESRPLWIGLR